jgi:hypothetical protein
MFSVGGYAAIAATIATVAIPATAHGELIGGKAVRSDGAAAIVSVGVFVDVEPTVDNVDVPLPLVAETFTAADGTWSADLNVPAVQDALNANPQAQLMVVLGNAIPVDGSVERAIDGTPTLDPDYRVRLARTVVDDTPVPAIAGSPSILAPTPPGCSVARVATYFNVPYRVFNSHSWTGWNLTSTYGQQADTTFSVGASITGTSGTFSTSGTWRVAHASSVTTQLPRAGRVREWTMTQFNVAKYRYTGLACAAYKYKLRPYEWTGSLYSSTVSPPPVGNDGNCNNILGKAVIGANGSISKNQGKTASIGGAGSLLGFSFAAQTQHAQTRSLTWRVANRTSYLCGLSQQSIVTAPTIWTGP